MSNNEENIESRSAYRGIMKATSLFGGLQVYQIVINIIRSKFIAVLLGPEGMGIMGLFQSAIDFIKAGTSFGLDQSAVRDVAEAYGENDTDKVSFIISVIRKLVIITGIGGMVIAIILSPLLSYAAFGSIGCTASFVALSVILLLEQIKSGRLVILQGLRKYKYLSVSSAIGMTLALIVTTPLYYIFGLNGIIPALIFNSIVTLSLAVFFARKVNVKKVHVTITESVEAGKGMLSLGLVMCLNILLVMGCSYILKGYISHYSGVENVGLYQAGFAIVNTYVGMVFSAMNTDYYPRLATVCHDDTKSAEMINRQAEVSLLIIAPIASIALIFTPIMLELLYSDMFVLANEYVKLAMFGMMFRAISWSIGNVFIAKGESKLFSKTTVFFNLLFLLDDLIWFSLMGIPGLGYSFALNYLFHLICVYLIAKRKYSFRFESQMIQLFVVFLVLTTLVLIVSYVENSFYRYTLGILLIGCIMLYSCYKINKYIDVIGIIMKKR